MIPAKVPAGDPWLADEHPDAPTGWRAAYAAAVREDPTIGHDGECPTDCGRCGGEGCRPARAF